MYDFLFYLFLTIMTLFGLALVFHIPVHWYIALWLAQYDFIFTKVSEGHFKVVIRFGSVRKILMSKKGHKLDGDGLIVESDNDSQIDKFGGLRLIGWPGLDRIYSREMNFKKSLQTGVKDYSVENVTEFFAKVDYPYVVQFQECEDCNNIPLSGHATLLARIVHPYKSLFATTDFYKTMLGLVMPLVRNCFESYSFTVLKEATKKQRLDSLIWEYLNDPKKNSQSEYKLSVVDELRDEYGVEIVAFRVILLNPPPNVRKSSLKKWHAEMDREAAAIVAEKEAEETEGRVIEAVAKANGLSRQELEQILKKEPNRRGISAIDGGFREDFIHARDLVKRDRAGKGLRDIRIGNTDGTSIEPNLTSLIGGLQALFGEKPRNTKRKKKPQKFEDLDEDSDDEF